MPVSEEQMIALMKSKGISDEQISQGRAIKQARSITQPQQQFAQQPQAAPQGQPQSINEMLRRINPVMGDAVGKMAGAIQQVGGVTPKTSSDDLATFMAKEQYKLGLKPKPTEAPTGYTLFGDKPVADPSFVDPVEQSRIDLNKQRMGAGGGLTPARAAQKDKRTERLFNTIEINKVKRGLIKGAEEALPNLPQGLGGKLSMWWMKNFDADNPTLESWQKVKSVLTDATLMNTAMTKGAISDFEMEEIMTAAANDDLISIKRIKPVIDKLTSFLDADESAQMSTFNRVYNEDPAKWPEMQEETEGRTSSGNTFRKL